MKFQKWIEEDKQIEILTSWQYQNQFYNFPSLNELFDKDVYIDIKKNTSNIFITKFDIEGEEWTFEAKNRNDIWFIAFYSKFGPDMYNSKGETEYAGEVFAGVFRSVKRLIENNYVNGIAFNTEDKKLTSLYNRMIKWVEKRFPEFYFKEKFVYKSLTQYLFMRKE